MTFRVGAIGLALAWPFLASAADPATVYQLITIAGSDWVGDAGPAVAAQIAQPEGLVIDAAGNLYIADAANHRVRKVNPDGTITTIAGTGHAGFSGDEGPAAAAQLNQPYGLTLDASGNLYIADFGNQRVRRIGLDGIIHTFADQLLRPRNVAADAAGNVYVSEFEGHCVRRLAPDGTITLVAGMGTAGYSGDGGPAVDAQLAFPAGLALDRSGALYIVDTANLAVRKVKGGLITTVCDKQMLGTPYLKLAGIAADPAGRVYISDSYNNYVWQLSPDGTLNRVAGAPGSNVSSADGGSALETALMSPVDLTLDPAGNLLLSETSRVREVSAATGIIATVAGTGIFGFSGDNGDASQAVLNWPAGLAVDGGGNLYVADQGNQRVRQITPAGIISTAAGTGQASFSGDGSTAIGAGLNAPSALAFDAAGNWYIADTQNGRVRQVNTAGIIVTVAGDGLNDGYGGNGGAATQTSLIQPRGVAAGSDGNLYVADTGHHRVLEVDSVGNILTVAGTGTAGNDGVQLNGPTGLAFAGGNLYIADSLNHAVRLLTGSGVLSTIASTGLSYPCALAIDQLGDVFIADSGTNRIFVLSPNGNLVPVAGTGDATFNGEAGAALQIAISSPCGLVFDPQGNLLVADSGNNRVRRLSLTAEPPPPTIPLTVANAASLLPGPLAPGEIFTIFGPGIGPAQPSTGAFDANGMLPLTLGNVQVLVGTVPAPLLYVQSNQINAQVPYEIAGQTSVQLQVVSQGTVLATAELSLAAASPALFTMNYGTGEAVVVNQDGTLNSDQNPAPRGSLVVLYATGQGLSTITPATGQAAQAPYGVPLLPVSLSVAGIDAPVLWAGSAPGFVGLLQINAQIPSGFVPAGDLPVLLTVGTFQGPAGVTIAVK